MSRRTERVNNLIRNTLGQLLLSKLSDPRIDPARTSITHVEVDEDFLTAKVFISVMGDEAEQKKALMALRHASGHLQDLLRREITLRNTPILDFVPDEKFKKTLKTLEIIQQAMEELRQKEASQQAAGEDEGEQSTGGQDETTGVQ